jgi:hypothetical protein
MHLDGKEFVRRYLLHILPKGRILVRHYGFLANRCRVAKLAQIREVLEQDEAITESTVGHGSSVRELGKVLRQRLEIDRQWR